MCRKNGTRLTKHAFYNSTTIAADQRKKSEEMKKLSYLNRLMNKVPLSHDQQALVLSVS